MPNLVFLSAQPDDYYFVWQLELQLYNFSGLGISPEQIHILIGYDPGRGLRHYFVEFMERYRHKACFFPYPDDRQQQKYASSIRPHIIQQHFRQNPQLQAIPIFYHDSDIIFRELPDFATLLQDDIVYVSDTRSYLDSRYVLSNASDVTFYRMCAQVGVSPDKVIENDENCGGAQYLLKGVGADFWNKIEIDSEAIYRILTEGNLQLGDRFLKEGKNLSDFNGIQSWCADMWACLYNLLYFERKVKISSELDFSWASGPISEWERKKILHYTGAVERTKGSFNKSKYKYYSPYYDRAGLEEVDKNSASDGLIQLIERFMMDQAENKIDLTDVTFLIIDRIDSPGRLKSLEIVTSFLDRFFKTNIVILEPGEYSNISIDNFPSICKHYLLKTDDRFSLRTRLRNYLIEEVTTSIIVIYGIDVVLPIQQILDSTMLLRAGEAAAVSPYDGRMVPVDRLFNMLFEKLIDPEVFLFNMEKHNVMTDQFQARSFFVLKDVCIKIGMEEELLNIYGLEDNGWLNRITGPEYVTKQVNGPLFCLPQEQNEDLA